MLDLLALDLNINLVLLEILILGNEETRAEKLNDWSGHTENS